MQNVGAGTFSELRHFCMPAKVGKMFAMNSRKRVLVIKELEILINSVIQSELLILTNGQLFAAINRSLTRYNKEYG